MMFMPMIWNRDRELMERNPFDELDRMFSDFWGDASNPFNTSLDLMKTDVVEEEKAYRLMAELPGFDRSDIDVEMKDGILTISASHEEKTEEKPEESAEKTEEGTEVVTPAPRYIRRERRNVSYKRSFNVGEEIRPEEITAKYKNGILTLVIPKKEPEVKVNTGKIAIE